MRKLELTEEEFSRLLKLVECAEEKYYWKGARNAGSPLLQKLRKAPKLNIHGYLPSEYGRVVSAE